MEPLKCKLARCAFNVNSNPVGAYMLQFLVSCLFLEALAETTVNPVVEGFEGGSVTLPCTLTGREDLQWWRGNILILVKTPDGSVVIGEGPYQGVASLVGEGRTDLSISSLNRVRDQIEGGFFRCLYGDEPNDEQETKVRMLAKITGARIDEASSGTVTITQGERKILTCNVTGDPIPAPSYRWRVDGGPVSGQERTFSLTADRSTRTVTCTATNTYSNGTELSREDATAAINVHLLSVAPISAIVGGVLWAMVLILAIVVIILFIRRRRTAGPGKSDHKVRKTVTSHGDVVTDEKDSKSPGGRVYQELSVAPEYANSVMEKPYEAMTKAKDLLKPKRLPIEDEVSDVVCYENIDASGINDPESSDYEITAPAIDSADISNSAYCNV